MTTKVVAVDTAHDAFFESWSWLQYDGVFIQRFVERQKIRESVEIVITERGNDEQNKE